MYATVMVRVMEHPELPYLVCCLDAVYPAGDCITIAFICGLN